MAHQSIVDKRIRLLEMKAPERAVKYCWIDAGDNEAEKVKAMQLQYPENKIISIGWQHG